MENQTEIWKLVKGYEDYQISNLGRVKLINYRNTGKSRILKPIINSRGYYNIGLTNKESRKTLAIHKLLAIAFLDFIPCGSELVIDHIDHNSLNNSLDNLQIVSTRENLSKDKFRKDITSKYVGVSWHKKNSKWRANIRINGRAKQIGVFDNEYDAHLAYQSKLKEIQYA